MEVTTPKTRRLGSHHEVVARIEVETAPGAPVVLSWLATNGLRRHAKWPNEVQVTWRYDVMRDVWILQRMHIYGWPRTAQGQYRRDRIPFGVPLDEVGKLPAWFRNAVMGTAPQGSPVLAGWKAP